MDFAILCINMYKLLPLITIMHIMTVYNCMDIRDTYLLLLLANTKHGQLTLTPSHTHITHTYIPVLTSTHISHLITHHKYWYQYTCKGGLWVHTNAHHIYVHHSLTPSHPLPSTHQPIPSTHQPI